MLTNMIQFPLPLRIFLLRVTQARPTFSFVADESEAFSKRKYRLTTSESLPSFVMSVAKVAGPVLAMSTHRYDLGISRSRCRNLFGPIDHEKLRSEQREELKRIWKEKERRWNFDFVNQRPLEGNYEWERIGGDRSEDTLTTTVASRIEESSSSAAVSERSSTSHEGNGTNRTRQGANSKVNCLKTPERTGTKPQRKSPRITGKVWL